MNSTSLVTLCNTLKRVFADAPVSKDAARLSLAALLLLLSFVPATRAQDAPASGSQGAVVSPPAPETARRTSNTSDDERPAPGAAGSIEGRVIDDQGQPIPNAGVRLAVRGGAMFQGAPATATDEDGRFRLDNLDPGVYTLFATAPGYVLEPERLGPRYFRVGETATLTMIKGGVITGSVTTQTGDPVIGVNVYATFVRELDGSISRSGQGVRGFRRDIRTDDRGVYRLYGLEPGVYVVAAGGGSPLWFNGLPNPYEIDAPTFYPSSTRDTATEITVRSGQETLGIDIRYRGERGHSISGTISSAAEPTDAFGAGISISLLHAPTGANIAMAFVAPREQSRAFSFEGIPDGDYDLVARQTERDGRSHASEPQRVTVRGADVTGLKIALAPMASVSGSLILAPLNAAGRASEQCAAQTRQGLLPQETLVAARRDERDAPRNASRGRVMRADTAPDAQGAFTIRNLDAGRFRLDARALSDDWYLLSVQLPAATTPRTPAARQTPARVPQRAGGAPANTAANTTAAAAPPLREPFTLTAGQRLSGLTVTLSEGASNLRGRVVAAAASESGGVEAAALPARLRVHLVPLDASASDDPLRFAETVVNADGTFALTHLAPGRYRVLARLSEQDAPEGFSRPLAWDADTRARLRREAETDGFPIDLQPCQRVQEFTLRYK
ncbi:MAG TPA: carboxypeptidase-like regulatory domain-containing protein [Pyrinomonadaceae bacterium]|nr:carboxypeptidase-like regulatory domain-containing protein [Pyrinomonadaceae bacterium]